MSAEDRKDGLEPVYLITGSDEPKVELAARRLRRRVIDDSGTDLNIDIFDAGRDGATAVLQAADTPPFGDAIRLVMVNNIGQWRKADKDTVAAYLASPPDYCCLALVGAGLRKNEALYKAVAAAGDILAYDAPRASDLPAWVMEQARRHRLKMEPPEARRLIALAGTEQRVIMAELDKIAAYKGMGTGAGKGAGKSGAGGSGKVKGKVRMEDIEAVCWVSTDAKVWDLTDAIGARDSEATFMHLEELLGDRNEPGSVFFIVARHLKRLSHVTSALEKGEDPARAAAGLGMKPYPARKLAGQSANFTSAGLKRALRIFSDLDVDLKGGSELRSDLSLELAVARVLEEL